MNILFIGGGVIGSKLLDAIARTRHDVTVAVLPPLAYSSLRRTVWLLYTRIVFYFYFARLAYRKLRTNCLFEAIWLYRLKFIISGNVNSRNFYSIVRRLQPDVILVSGSDEIFKRDILDLPRIGCLNCHPSLLPAYRGPNPIYWAIRNGEKTTGVTFHLITERIDDGRIVYQKEILIDPSDTSVTLTVKCAVTAVEGIDFALKQFEKKEFVAASGRIASPYYPNIGFVDRLLNLQDGRELLERSLRALVAFTLPLMYLDGRVIEFGDYEFVPDKAIAELPVGRILSITPDCLKVKYSAGVLAFRKFCFTDGSRRNTFFYIKNRIENGMPVLTDKYDG